MRVLGLDCGIASVGWAVLEMLSIQGTSAFSYQIIACGSYCFNQPIVGGTGKDKFTSLKSAKRQRIGHMHFLHRKKVKMNDLRRELHAAKILPDAKSEALALAMARISPKGQAPQITPYDLRASALNRLLTNDEFSVVIGHLVAHPGPRPSEKSRDGSNEPEKGRIRGAVAANSLYQQRGYQTAGEMLALDPQFTDRKHNAEKDWKQSIGRKDIEKELRTVFTNQAQLKNQYAISDLLNAVLKIMERRKEPSQSYFPVGGCRFIDGEARAATRSYSYERFRFAQTLSHLAIDRDGPERPTPDEILLAMDDFGAKPRTTFADLRKIWNLAPDAKFTGIKANIEDTRDFATAKGDSAHGTHTLRQVLGSNWLELSSQTEIIDRIAHVISFATKESVVDEDIRALGLDDAIHEKLLAAYKNGVFDGFVKAGDISAKAAALLTPHLQGGMTYSDACVQEGYDHTAKSASLQENRNPVTQHAVKEYLATIDEIIVKYGVPDEIRIEMARDVAWSEAKKLEYSEIIDDARRRNIKIAKECEDCIGTKPSGTQILKYRLAKEQGFKSLYSGKSLCDAMKAGFDGLEIEHILPESRFHMGGDKGNLVVCLSGENANKHDSTPWEWSERDPGFDWAAFKGRIKVSHDLPKRKKRLLQMQSTDEIENGFKKRNLVDTQYAVKLLSAELGSYFDRKFPTSNAPQIVGRPGRLVGWLRRGWGVDHLKHDLERVRLDDGRHHAVDAIIVAAIDGRMIDVASACAKRNETAGKWRHSFRIDPPWENLQTDVEAAIEAIPIVARARKDGFGGALHKDTIYGLSEIDGKLLKRERKSVDKKLTLKDLERFEDRSDKGHIKEILRKWIEDGHPKERLPSWKYGMNPDGTERRMLIRKITLLTNEGPEVTFNRLEKPNDDGESEPFATYNRADMIRVDVFKAVGTVANAKHLFVPVYPHQMNDDLPPSRFFKRGIQMSNWPTLNQDDEFVISLSKLDLVEVTSRGAARSLYYRGFDTNTGVNWFSPPFSLADAEEIMISQTNLDGLRKLRVDRIGTITSILDETRTWRGKACI